MSQSGYTPISLYYSSTASAVPTAGNLVAGELALNNNDGRLFYKDSAGVVQVIGTKGGVGSSTTTQVLYNSSGLVVGSANMTFDGTTLTTANDASISGLTVGKGGGAQGGNTALGASALAANTIGNNNVAAGIQALLSNTTGFGSAAVGVNSLYSNTTGASNTALGTSALFSNTTASNNTAVGYQAGYSNTTGAANAFFGLNAGYANTTAYNNTYIGAGAGSACTTGHSNSILGTFNGNQGGLDIRTASNYIVLSDGDGNPRGVFNSSGSMFVGCVTTPSSSVAGFELNSPNTSQPKISCGSFTGTISMLGFYNGNGQVGQIFINGSVTTYSSVSDYRLKTVIGSVSDSGERLDALEPIEYDWNTGGRTRGFLAHQFAEVTQTALAVKKMLLMKKANQFIKVCKPQVLKLWLI